MSDNHEIFIQSIHSIKLVRLTFSSKEKGMSIRICVPYDFGPSRRYKDGLDRYHFHDLDSPDGSHNLSILAEQIHLIEMLEDAFDPSYYVTWTPNWIIKRDWGKFS